MVFEIKSKPMNACDCLQYCYCFSGYFGSNPIPGECCDLNSHNTFIFLLRLKLLLQRLCCRAVKSNPGRKCASAWPQGQGSSGRPLRVVLSRCGTPLRGSGPFARCGLG